MHRNEVVPDHLKANVWGASIVGVLDDLSEPLKAISGKGLGAGTGSIESVFEDSRCCVE
jgi:hypothetical protein